jgi:DNA-binding GntR family transcriptional regulator
MADTGAPMPMRDAVEAAYRSIRDGILNGLYVSGQHVTGEQLAGAVGVSRTPVREALRRLHAEGLVRVVPNQGAYVTGFTAADIAQMFGLRAVLECYAVELAVPNLTDAQIDRIAVLAERTFTLAMERPEGFREAIAQANSELHVTIVRAAAEPRLAGMIASVVELPLVMRTLRVYTQDDLLRSAGHHRELAVALRARDAGWAAAVMRSHLLAAKQAILREGRPEADASQV